jgi:hypothetical protein
LNKSRRIVPLRATISALRKKQFDKKLVNINSKLIKHLDEANENIVEFRKFLCDEKWNVEIRNSGLTYRETVAEGLRDLRYQFELLTSTCASLWEA